MGDDARKQPGQAEADNVQTILTGDDTGPAARHAGPSSEQHANTRWLRDNRSEIDIHISAPPPAQ